MSFRMILLTWCEIKDFYICLIYSVKLNSTYKTGQYKLVLSLKYGEENNWEVIEEFKISSEESKEIKEVVPALEELMVCVVKLLL